VPEENKQRTSFIPKKSEKKHSAKISLYSLFGIIVIVLVIFSWIGLFLYENWLEGEIEDLQDKLVTPEETYDQDEIESFITIDHQILVLDSVLDRQIVSSELFKFLEDNTAINISYSSFSYNIFQGSNPSVVLRGLASSFGALAFQMDVFKDQENVVRRADLVSMDISGGRVSFAIELELERSLILYR